eukprot:COSAG01_NODE_6983_length_3404_cov_4.728593_4_plen_135_part_00
MTDSDIEQIIPVDKLSPKFFEILTRVNKFVDETGKPIGKILFYSEFRSDSGGEIFDKILEANGYEKYDYTKPLTKSKKYTFYTGLENKLERKKNFRRPVQAPGLPQHGGVKGPPHITHDEIVSPHNSSLLQRKL